jgi:ABC-type uncharacterized transport system ATPase subunit
MELIKMTGITKEYPGTVALKDVDFYLKKGEILSLLGENGAGKTTLMKILYGMEKQDKGEIYINGEQVSFSNPNDAIARGICMVHQHFMLVPAFTVTENVIAGIEPTKNKYFVDHKQAEDRVRELINRYNFNIDADAKIESLSVGEQQRVEILKALYRDASILILDEPSAVLTPNEVDELFVTLRKLQSQGTSIVIITHKLRETMSIADRAMVLRSGLLTHDSVDPSLSSVQELSELMVGRLIRLDNRQPSEKIGSVMFSVKDLVVKDDRGVERLKGISFDIREGEILGFAGVEGNGQTQILEAVTGLIQPESIEMTLNGEIITGDARAHIDCGIGHVPEDRSTMGLVGGMSIKSNFILGYHGYPDVCKNKLMRWKEIYAFGENCRENFQVKTPNIEAPVSSLSGGNQQKVVMARVLSREQKVLVAAHPTRGLDVGAMEYVHQQIFDFRDQGKAVLLISAELDEVVRLSDRLMVLFEGKIVAECDPTEFTKTELGLLMTGHSVETVRGMAS